MNPKMDSTRATQAATRLTRKPPPPPCSKLQRVTASPPPASGASQPLLAKLVLPAMMALCLVMAACLSTVVQANPAGSHSGQSGAASTQATSGTAGKSFIRQPIQDQQQQQREQAQLTQQTISDQQSAARQIGDFEAELNSIVQQHGDILDSGTNKLLAEAIISRLMLDNLTGSTGGNGNFDNEPLSFGPAGGNAGELISSASEEMPMAELAASEQVQAQQQQQYVGPTLPEVMRLKKLISFLQNYETSNGGYGNGGAQYEQFPMLPAGQAATMKRAAMKMNAYLQQPQQRHLANGGYQRNSFDFGLGKRPDSDAGAASILRFGDSSLGLGGGGGSVQPVGQFGKRPSAHRYDFGLGKRVASPAYPRYDFGLGKRAPNRIRYDFGLGRK